MNNNDICITIKLITEPISYFEIAGGAPQQRKTKTMKEYVSEILYITLGVVLRAVHEKILKAKKRKTQRKEWEKEIKQEQ